VEGLGTFNFGGRPWNLFWWKALEPLFRVIEDLGTFILALEPLFWWKALEPILVEGLEMRLVSSFRPLATFNY
jgi:hypothetical protein